MPVLSFPSATNLMLGGAFSYSTALAELEEAKRRSRLMASAATAAPGAKAGVSPPAVPKRRQEAGCISEASRPSTHPWEDDLAWRDLGAFVKVCVFKSGDQIGWHPD